MGWSFRIARIFGIEVRIHVTFLLLLAFFAYQGYAQGRTLGAALVSVGFILLLFVCVLLHEFGHALAAARYGIKTPDITLLPIGGVARLQRMPDKPLQELVVAIAGPLVNVVIAGSLLLGLGLRAGLGRMADIENPAIAPLQTLAVVNIWLVLFNLIPAFPMDGGRMLRALLATRMNYARATRIAATVGQVLAFGFGIWGVTGGGPMLLLIAVFIYFGAAQEAAAAQMRDLARSVPVSDAMITRFSTLAPDDALASAVEALLRTNQHEFPIIDSSGQVAGILTRDDMIRALRSEGPNVPIASVMRRDVLSVPADVSFDRAFQLMNEATVPAVLVRDRAGRVVGVITPENVGEMMMVQAALDDRRHPSGWLAPTAEPGGLGPADAPLPRRAPGR
jgi:Zn-dependent protease/CBS domain-containing protein